MLIRVIIDIGANLIELLSFQMVRESQLTANQEDDTKKRPPLKKKPKTKKQKQTIN